MISKSLSTSEKRAALHVSVPELAEFCQQLYPLLVAHSDDFGRLQGDCFTVKHLIDPSSPRPIPEFERALVALHDVGLIVWYEVAGRRYIQIEHFDEHQSGLTKRTSPKFPEPPGDSSNFLESPDQSNSLGNGTSVKVTEKSFELKGTEQKGTEGKRTTRVARAAFDAWIAIYPKQEDVEKAWAEWKKLNPSEAEIAQIMAATQGQRSRKEWLDDDGKYIPLPKNWLRGKRWTDRITRESEGTSKGQVRTTMTPAVAARIRERQGAGR